MKTAKSLNWVVAILGIWELLAPFILSYSKVQKAAEGAQKAAALPKTGNAMWDAIIIGIVLLIVGAWAALSNSVGLIKSLSWLNAILGLWLIIAPFTLGYSKLASAMWNDVVIGIIVLVVGAWAALVAKEV